MAFRDLGEISGRSYGMSEARVLKDSSNCAMANRANVGLRLNRMLAWSCESLNSVCSALGFPGRKGEGFLQTIGFAFTLPNTLQFILHTHFQPKCTTMYQHVPAHCAKRRKRHASFRCLVDLPSGEISSLPTWGNWAPDLGPSSIAAGGLSALLHSVKESKLQWANVDQQASWAQHSSFK